MPRLPALILLFAFAPAAMAGAGHEAHVHGVASVDVAIDGNVLSIDLDTPADNLLGFEHTPRSADEKQRAGRVAALLAQPDTLFRINPEAGCVAAKPALQAPILSGSGATGEHNDIEASFGFNCARPAALANLNVLLFDAFPRLNSIKLQLAGPKGQRGQTLQKGQRSVSLK